MEKLKIEYSIWERQKAKETKKCVGCEGELLDVSIYLGHVFCQTCQRKRQKILPLDVCLSCANCGIYKKENVSGGYCKEHLVALRGLCQDVITAEDKLFRRD